MVDSSDSAQVHGAPAEGGAPRDGQRGGRRRRKSGGKPPQDGGPRRPDAPQGKGPNQSAGARPAKTGNAQRPAAGAAPRRDGQTPRGAKAKQAEAKPAERAEPPFKHVLQRYGLAIYDTVVLARADKEALISKAATVDQLNIVIRAEGALEDPELSVVAPNVKLFSGTAWALIHDRRVADGWYDEPR